MTHAHEFYSTKKRPTCMDYMMRAHEAFEAGLAKDTFRYQKLRSDLDTRSRMWLDHLESHFQILDFPTILPAPPLIGLEGVPLR